MQCDVAHSAILWVVSSSGRKEFCMRPFVATILFAPVFIALTLVVDANLAPRMLFGAGINSLVAASAWGWLMKQWQAQ